MLQIEYTVRFKRDLKLAKKRKNNLELLRKIMKQIENEEPLGPKLKDHPLIGSWKHHRELHIEPDWLLIYKILAEEKTVIFVCLGTHADLFS